MRKLVFLIAIPIILTVAVSTISCGPPTKEPSERPTVIEFFSET